LLVKFIDSRQDLSVQVHPDDKLAMKRHGCQGKTEMWYVIKSDVGAKIYSGLKKNITPDEYERLANTPVPDGSPSGSHSPMQDVIATHEAHDGDLYFLPAGRLHAIGAGNFLAEIQETSDITYRVYDFGRKDAHGRPRELHIAEARDAIDYRVWPEYRSSYDSTKPISQLVNCPHFVVHRVVVQVASQVDFHCDSFVVVMCLWGEANINGISIRQGETILVPACENVLYIFGNASFLTATIG
jgi:mannose-6-phosphate isomerase